MPPMVADSPPAAQPNEREVPIRARPQSRIWTVVMWLICITAFVTISTAPRFALGMFIAPAVYVVVGLAIMQHVVRREHWTLPTLRLLGVPLLLAVAGATVWLVSWESGALAAAGCAVTLALPVARALLVQRRLRRIQRALRERTLTDAMLADVPTWGELMFTVVALLLRHEHARVAVRLLLGAGDGYAAGRAFWMMEARLRLGDAAAARDEMKRLESAGDESLIPLARSRLDVLDGRPLDALAHLDRAGTVEADGIGLAALRVFARADALVAAGRRDDARTALGELFRAHPQLAPDLVGSGRPAADLAREIVERTGPAPFR
jgi:hypothetical protein